MRRQNSSSAAHAIRPVPRVRLLSARHQRLLITALIILTMGITATGAFAAGRSQIQTEVVKPVADRSSITAFENRVAARDIAAVELEKVNLVTQLSQQKNLNEQLSGMNEQLSGSIEVKEKTMDTLEDTILKSLLANLDQKSVSRSGATLANYIKEARNLVDLSRKLQRFKKTANASAIDLTAYEDKIRRRLANLPTLKPIPGVVDGYGWRIHPIFHYRQFHAAADMGAPKGTPIKAAAAGRVIAAGYSSSSGNYIKISHGNGFVTSYLHCSKLNVQSGATVSKGQVIGLVGSTGNSTEPHLHFAIELNGEPLNPASIIME